MRAALALAAALAAACLLTPASAQKSYGPGVSDTEIKIGNTMPYSGPASPLSITGRVISAYFDEINEKGGVNGRKLNLISLDDAFSPPKTMEAARRLVEGDGVAFIFATMGTAPSSAIAKYLNSNKVPQIFLISSASKWNDPANMPWSMALPWAPNYTSEAAIDVAYARAKDRMRASRCSTRTTMPARNICAASRRHSAPMRTRRSRWPRASRWRIPRSIPRC